MKNMKWLCLVLAIAAAYSCKEDQVLYDSGQKPRLLFIDNDTTTTRVYSIVFELSDQESFLYEIQVNIMGMPPEEDAVFEIELLRDTMQEWVVGDSQREVVNGEEGVDFELGKLVIEKGKTSGKIPVRIYRKDYMMEKYVSVLMTIKENDNFQPMKDECFRLLISDGEPSCPLWWSTGTPSTSYYYPTWCMFLGNFTPDKFRMLLNLYWETEQTSPVFYYEVFDKYGRYLSDTYLDAEGQTVQTPNMFFYNEKPALWASLILQPLCEYYKQYYASLPPGSPIEDIRTSYGPDGEYWLDPVLLL